jgi:hypothetical protein
MNDQDFEGTLILEKLAEIGKVEEFFEAVDFSKVQSLMRQAEIDSQSIGIPETKIPDLFAKLNRTLIV